MFKPLQSWPIAIAALLICAQVPAQEATQSYAECTREPSEPEIKAAKGAFQAGQVAFDEGDYDRAITYWEDAYRRDCTAHAMLLNLARVYELADRKQQAVVALETYLQRDPETSKRDVISRRIQVLREKIAEEQKAEEPPPPAPPATVQPPPPAPIPPQPTPVPPEPPPSKPLAPLIVAGAGGVLFAVGGILYLGAASDVSEWEDRCPDRNCEGEYADRIDEANAARTRQTTWGVVSLVGLGVGLGGVAWYLASPADSSEPAAAHRDSRRTRLSPTMGPGFAGLQLSGAF